MNTELTTLKGIGEAVAAQLKSAGITTVEELRTLGAHAAYGKMMENGLRPHFIGYYALEMALQGRAWNDCTGAEKDKLRIKFDELRASLQGESALMRELRQIGIKI